MESLEREWLSKRELLHSRRIVSLYFGGGTPTQLSPEAIRKILSWVERDCSLADDIEITLEANPEDIGPRIGEFEGINRISMGVQSFDDKLLHTLGREHTAAQALRAIEHCAKSYANISIDLMYEIPGQTLQTWEQTLLQTAELPLTHLSLYNLTFEPNTPFFRRREALKPLVLPEEEQTLCFQMPERILKGMRRYEISAFAKPGCASRHNTGYWQGRPFLGLGPSAFSYWEGRRFRNWPSLLQWSRALQEGKSPVDYTEELEESAKKNELLIIGLRMLEGVEKKRIGPLDSKTVESLEQLEQLGLIKSSPKSWKLSPKGLLFHDTVAEMLVS